MGDLAQAIKNFCTKKQSIPLAPHFVPDWVLSLCPEHETECNCVLFISSEVLKQIIHPAFLVLKPPAESSHYENHDYVPSPARRIKLSLPRFMEDARKEKHFTFGNMNRAADGVPYIHEDNPEVKPFSEFSDSLLGIKPKYVVFFIRLPGDHSFSLLADLTTRRLESVTCVHSRLEGGFVRQLENTIVWFVLYQFSCRVVPTDVMRMPVKPQMHYCTILTIFYTFVRIRLQTNMQLTAPLCTEEKLVQFMHYFFEPNCKELAIGQ